MVNKVIELKDIHDNILLPYAFAAFRDGNNRDIATTYATVSTVNTKQDIITGAASSVTSNDLTASKALISNISGKIATSSVTSTELEYLSGTTSNVQTQINTIKDMFPLSDFSQGDVLVVNEDKTGFEPGGSIFRPQLFTYQRAEHKLNDIQWLRCDTFSWQNGEVYKAAYNHLVADMTSASEQEGETVEGIYIQFYRGSDGHKIVNYDPNYSGTHEDAVQAIYEKTGISWYYLVDITNKRFKLPRTKYNFTGYIDGVGNYVAPTLPQPELVARYDSSNSTIGGYHNEYVEPYGSDGSTIRNAQAVYNNTAGTDEYFLNVNEYNKWAKTNISGYKNITDLDLRDNAIYGPNNPVQPPATQAYLYCYVGDYTQSALEQTAGITAEVLNDKADKEEVVPNYFFYRWTGLSAVNSTVTYSFQFKCKKGHPIYLSISGDINPTTDSGWAGISIYKDGIQVAYEIAESHGASWNIPFCKIYLDTSTVIGQTYTYAFKLYDNGYGTINFQESGEIQSPTITVFEL